MKSKGKTDCILGITLSLTRTLEATPYLMFSICTAPLIQILYNTALASEAATEMGVYQSSRRCDV